MWQLVEQEASSQMVPSTVEDAITSRGEMTRAGLKPRMDSMITKVTGCGPGKLLSQPCRSTISRSIRHKRWFRSLCNNVQSSPIYIS